MSTLEWIVAAVSTLVVLGAIGLLLREAFGEPDTPPEIQIAVEEIVQTSSGYVVEFWAENRGSTTAASLAIEGELLQDTVSVETSSVTIDYVPGEARRKAGLFFSSDPRRYTLDIKAKGYDEP
jgi:uncharacterized protein (TIGR02588 family)